MISQSNKILYFFIQFCIILFIFYQQFFNGLQNFYVYPAKIVKNSLIPRFCLSLPQNPFTMENKLKRIYSGSVINAEFIGSVLEQNDIPFLIRNYQEESLVAGWAASTIKGDASVFVFDKDYDRAMLLLDEINASEMEEE